MSIKEKPPTSDVVMGAKDRALECNNITLGTGVPTSNAQFLGALFHPDDTCWTTHFPDNPSDATGACWGGRSCRPGDAVELPDQNAYFSVATFKDSTSRAYANFSSLPVVVLDDVQGCPLDPTWLLRTSTDKVQVGYRLSEPVADLGIAKHLHEQLAQAGRIALDQSGNNAVRYVRLPVGVNTKREPPYPCQLEVWQPEKTYSLSELIKGLKLDADYILHGKGKAAKPVAVGVGMIPEGARNTRLTSLAGSMRRQGAGQRSIVQALLIENAERCSPPLDESEVTTIGRSVSGYEPAEADDPRPSVFLGPSGGARCSALLTEPEEHEFIVDGLIPVCNGVMAAPGGVGKTTVTIYEAICLALGLDVYKRKVLRSGATLFVTGEDEREDYEYRLYWLMDAMHLTPIQRQIVTTAIFFEDVSDQMVRLAELNDSGNIVMTPYVDDLCRLYAGEGLAMCNIDPLVYFSPGERLVNDSESAMCQVGKRLSRELNCHVRFIAHTSKAVARDAITDQYAGRGGASLADGSRQFMQIAVGPHKDWPVPMEAAPLVLLGCEALRIHFHKVSYAVRPKAPIWFLRSGWGFTVFDGAKSDEKLDHQRDMARLCGYLASKLKEGIYYSKSSLEDASGDLGLTVKRIRQLVSGSVQNGELIYLDLPPELKHAKFQQYLAPGVAREDAANEKFRAEKEKFEALFGTAKASD